MPARFKITWKRTVVTPNVRRGTIASYEKTKSIFMEAVKGYVKGLASEVVKHADTGMSMASLIPFGRYVNALMVEAFSPKSLPRLGMTDILGFYRGDKYKSIPEGLKAGKQGRSFQVNFGSLQRQVFSFWFSIQVYQYLLHEFGYQTPPWDSMVQGRRQYYESMLKYRTRYFMKHSDFMDTKQEIIVS